MTSQAIGFLLIAGVLVALTIVIERRRAKHVRAPSVPPSDSPVAPPPAALTETEELIQALLVLDRNAAARMSSLKLYLFFLPLIWGVISGILWAIILALR